MQNAVDHLLTLPSWQFFHLNPCSMLPLCRSLLMDTKCCGATASSTVHLICQPGPLLRTSPSVLQVFLPRSGLLRSHLAHILHFLAFSIFSDNPPDSAAAAAAARMDLSVTLPPRIVLCSHLMCIAKYVCI